MFARAVRPEPDRIEVQIGSRARFSGTLECDASIRIDGAVEQGEIRTPANVILAESALVQCDIFAHVVSIRGKFKGVIQADRVELLDGSQVSGILNVNSFYMAENVVMRAAVNIRADAAGDVKLPPPPPHAQLPVSRPLPPSEAEERPQPPTKTEPNPFTLRKPT
jgi:cytoskeletal protein CcmA (bactofilin family)